MATPLPPGWPEQVRPPLSPEWERSAVAWLFDLCPPDYRAHDVLRRYPVVLARLHEGPPQSLAMTGPLGEPERLPVWLASVRVLNRGANPAPRDGRC